MTNQHAPRERSAPPSFGEKSKKDAAALFSTILCTVVSSTPTRPSSCPTLPPEISPRRSPRRSPRCLRPARQCRRKFLHAALHAAIKPRRQLLSPLSPNKPWPSLSPAHPRRHSIAPPREYQRKEEEVGNRNAARHRFRAAPPHALPIAPRRRTPSLSRRTPSLSRRTAARPSSAALPHSIAFVRRAAPCVA